MLCISVEIQYRSGAALRCGYGFIVSTIENRDRVFCRLRLTKEWFRFFITIKNRSVGTVNWRTSTSHILYSRVAISNGSATDGLLYISFFVANVNFDDHARLNVNVNRFENGNVWNAENRHRVVVPLLSVSLSLCWRESFVL